MLHALGRHSEAIDAMGQVMSQGDHDHRIHEARGLAWQADGNHLRAVDDFTKAVEQEPEAGETFYHRGVSLLALRRPRKAVEVSVVRAKARQLL